MINQFFKILKFSFIFVKYLTIFFKCDLKKRASSCFYIILRNHNVLLKNDDNTH